jgi:hypothetical protein
MHVIIFLLLPLVGRFGGREKRRMGGWRRKI